MMHLQRYLGKAVVEVREHGGKRVVGCVGVEGWEGRGQGVYGILSVTASSIDGVHRLSRGGLRK
jgi:hypothetical protein